MLGELERKLTALVGDLLAGRAGLAVVGAAEAGPAPAAGEGRVRVGLADLAPRAAFEPGQFAAAGADGAPARRRVLALQFTARLAFLREPADGTPAALATARARLLDDLSLAAHGLSAAALRDGADFATDSPDPGFRVAAFDLQSGSASPGAAGPAAGGAGGAAPPGGLAAELVYRGQVEIWPP